MKKHRTRAHAAWRIRASLMPGLPFADAVAWLVSQPEIAHMVFDKAKDAGAIRYNHVSNVWEGANRREDGNA